MLRMGGEKAMNVTSRFLAHVVGTIHQDWKRLWWWDSLEVGYLILGYL